MTFPLPTLDAFDVGPYQIIDSGASAFGWSKIESFIRCPQQYAFSYLIPDDKPPAEALSKGIIMHVGWAHHFERMRRQQHGLPTDTLVSPEAAMREVARGLREEKGVVEAGAHLDLCLKGINAQLRQYPFDDEQIEILAVEQLYTLKVTGNLTEMTPNGATPRSVTYPFTTRIDAVWRDMRTNAVFIVDHKTTSGPLGATHYNLSGSMLSKHLIGMGAYGNARFGGTKINQLSWRDFKGQRFLLDPQPHRLARWADDYVFHKHQMEQLTATRDPLNFPGAISEQVCFTKYGPCAHLDRCKWGR